jgi:hypothetical protein
MVDMRMPQWKPGPAPQVFIDSFKERVTPEELYAKYPQAAVGDTEASDTDTPGQDQTEVA